VPSETSKPKSIREVLRSARFHREVSLLLFIFAAVNGMFSVLLLAANGSRDVAMPVVIAYAVQAVIYAVLAVFIRRGSVKVLIFTGSFFAVDTVLTLIGPSWEDARSMIVARGLLLFVLVRYIARERARGAARP
jgi:hypothetical protein